MTYNRINFIFVALLCLGCGQHKHSSENDKSEAAKRFETVSYAGIVIFEGGKGQRPIIAATGGDYVPQWRWSICLDRSHMQREGQITIDLSNAPYTWRQGNESEAQKEQTISQISVQYAYQAGLVKLDENSLAEDITFHSIAATHDIPTNPLTSEMVTDHFGLAFEWTPQVGHHETLTTYHSKDSTYYLFSTLRPYRYFDSDDDIWKVSALCEGRSTTPFLLQGTDIPR